VALDSLGGLKKETGYSFSIELILRFATRCEAILSDAPYAVFTVHPGSSSVAEASEAFASTLNLAFFYSINGAIDSAANDNIVTQAEADEMKAVLRTTAEQNLFHGAFGLIARDQLSIAVQASEVLEAHFKRRYMAAAINAVAVDNRAGAMLRLVVKSAKAARGLWIGRKRSKRYPAYSQIVRARMAQLSI
jgi:hypothetical protein